MNDDPNKDFKLVTEEIPDPPQQGTVSSGKIIHGKLIPPQQQIFLFSADEWEAFVEEWLHFQKTQYSLVTRLSGASDMGVDVAGLSDDKGFQGVWDNYQCKHYGDPLTPKTAISEIGKCIWHASQGHFKPPRAYFFIAPKDCGMSLKKLLLNIPDLKKKLFEKWDDWCATSITSTQEIKLEGDFLSYVDSFDFSIFSFKPTLDIIEEHRKTPYFVARFGGGLPDRPRVEAPPSAPDPTESRYLKQLLDSYEDHEGQLCADATDLAKWPDLLQHFNRQREVFYHAESLRNFARDNVPQGTFEDLQDEVFAGVIDVESATHDDGFSRVNAVTQAAAQLPLTANGLISVTKIQDKKGICHQLANDDRLTWVKS
ncbi:ABC-three component system protein [Thalassobaculum salexigens]|uniref:ABC-three component system protein n=1 Tax=Thalassobaculum salexigens TaxID=455360 RepID=UPI0009FCAE86|nr:ABC-three component system protein [Thalassobaculum salexigens]